MRIFYTDTFVLPLPEGHRFPMEKYALLRRRLAESPAGRDASWQVPPPATDEQLALVHDEGYLKRVRTGTLDPSEQKKMGFPWSEGLVERSRRSVGATIAAGRAALQDRCAVSLAGGTHHAYRDRGEGYCVFNDAVVAIRVLQRDGLLERVLIVDCDVHQGDGTAALVRGDPSVFAFSIHGELNYPFRKEESDLDIPLPDGTGDSEYLEELEAGLDEVFRRFDPELVIYLAGADPYRGDRLGRLALTFDGLAERDRRVFGACRDRSLPVAVTMAGGYARRVEDTVAIHFETVRQAKELAPLRAEGGG